MRVYHLLKTENALKVIRKKRVKISLFSDLNDPFELLGANLKDKGLRNAFRAWKREVAEIYGLMCFSKDWRSPVLWSHYAERHGGICLGFDVPDKKVLTVRYLDSRIEIGEDPMDETAIKHFLTTKFVDWHYEQELRLITDLSEPDPEDGKYYVDMGDELKLTEVIVGALSKTTREKLVAEINAAGLDASQVQFTKARLAFKSYSVVPDKSGF